MREGRGHRQKGKGKIKKKETLVEWFRLTHAGNLLPVPKTITVMQKPPSGSYLKKVSCLGLLFQGSLHSLTASKHQTKAFLGAAY